MSIQDVVNNELVQDESSVWVLKQHSEFGYSDGVESELYLENVFRNVDDLSSASSELEGYIKDWPSEYHLTAKRAQLFAGFEFDPALKVLEVGCGCGAITRYLGENFDDVVSIEGSINRARLARLRTKDLEGVSIICAPFQEIDFTKKFDIIFCVGVYEYSASFVSGDDPYDSVLSYFSEMLSSNGIVVIAIENQFGLKYFTSSREDHTGRMFEGLEGYHAQGNKVKTFGKNELEGNLKKYFSCIEFYYPYPDYKLPTCILSDEFLMSDRAGELVSQMRSRDYHGQVNGLWNESHVSLELSRNGMLPFFSNSFLVFAGKAEIKSVEFDQLAVMSSSQRVKEFRTQTRIFNNEDDEVVVSKKSLSGGKSVTIDKLSLVESSSTWMNSHSLQTEVYKRCLSREMNLEDMFKPCRVWVDFLEGVCDKEGREGVLTGEYVDCIWSNVYLSAAEVSLIDQEWVWKDNVKLNVVIIRAIFTFLQRIEGEKHLSCCLQGRSLKKLISRISKNIGVILSKEDFSDFIKLETEFQFLVHGLDSKRNSVKLKLLLFDRASFYFIRNLNGNIIKIINRTKRVFSRI